MPAAQAPEIRMGEGSECGLDCERLRTSEGKGIGGEGGLELAIVNEELGRTGWSQAAVSLWLGLERYVVR